MRPLPAPTSLVLSFLLGMFLPLSAAIQAAYAESITHVPDAHLQTIRAILESPDDQIDLAKAKLAIDHMIDPGIDIAKNLKQLDAIAAKVKSQLPARATSRQKLDALRSYIYQAGPWNANRPFHYDLDDPFGQNIRNKLLPNYLATRKGNCVSMPLLFIVLGQKLGIDVTASTAPEHIFVKYRDELGTYFNLEATSGAGFTRDVWVQQQNPMTAEALANGIYMQPLTKKETVVVMAGTLLEWYGQQGQEEYRIALASLVLAHYPKYVPAMLHTASACYRLRQRHFVNKYPMPRDIPEEQRPYFMQLDQGMRQWRGKAEALGWREPDEAANRDYLQRVNNAKSVQ